jgi:hypothetical protein
MYIPKPLVQHMVPPYPCAFEHRVALHFFPTRVFLKLCILTQCQYE